MLYQLIVLVALMMAVTYSWKPAGRGRGRSRANTTKARMTGSFEKVDSFQGRHKNPPKARHHSIDKGNLTRCHNCSCFFPMGQVVHDIVEGHLLEFCSSTCRANFLHPRH